MNNLLNGYGADTPSLSLANTLVIGGKAVDGRTIPARRYKAICSDLASDLGHVPGAGETIMIQRAAALVVQAELIEAAIVCGEAYDAETHLKLSNSLSRILAGLGLRTRDGKRAQTVDSWAEAFSTLSGDSADNN